MKYLLLIFLCGWVGLLHGQKFLGGAGDGYATSRLTLAADVVDSVPEVRSFPGADRWEIWVQLDPTRGAADLELFDVRGRLILRENITESEWQLTNSLPAAAYLVRIRQAGEVYTRKIAVLER